MRNIVTFIENLSIKVINLKHRQDRRDSCNINFNNCGVTPSCYEFFDAYYHKSLGHIGCSLSHAMVLSEFLYKEDKNYILILEDDFTVRDHNNFVADLNSILSYGHHWDVYLLAHNFALPILAVPLMDTFQVVNAQTTSGYLVRREYIPNLIKIFFKSAENLKKIINHPDDVRKHLLSVFSADQLWKSLQNKDKFWARFPSVTLQSESYSDIEKTTVNYKV
jgi:glycosyl transferase, family 25